jgi:hypothetical protein
VTDYKAFDSSPNITFSGAGLPTQSELGAKTEDIFQNTLTGELFVCDVQTFGSQVWKGSQGNSAGLLDPILDPNNPNLVAFYTMDNISGSTLVDETVNNNDGTITGAVAVSGKIGNALDFDGSTDFVNLDDILNSTFTGAGKKFTISLWVNPDVVNVQQQILNKNGDGNQSENQRQMVLSIASDASVRFGFFGTITGATLTLIGTTSTISSGVYTHIFVEYDQTISVITDKADIYFNNVIQTTALIAGGNATEMVASTSRLCLGGQIGSSTGTGALSDPLNGKLDQIRIFDRLLTSDEKTSIFNEGTP